MRPDEFMEIALDIGPPNGRKIVLSDREAAILASFLNICRDEILEAGIREPFSNDLPTKLARKIDGIRMPKEDLSKARFQALGKALRLVQSPDFEINIGHHNPDGQELLVYLRNIAAGGHVEKFCEALRIYIEREELARQQRQAKKNLRLSAKIIGQPDLRSLL